MEGLRQQIESSTKVGSKNKYDVFSVLGGCCISSLCILSSLVVLVIADLRFDFITLY